MKPESGDQLDGKKSSRFLVWREGGKRVGSICEPIGSGKNV